MDIKTMVTFISNDTCICVRRITVPKTATSQPLLQGISFLSSNFLLYDISAYTPLVDYNSRFLTSFS